MRRMKKTQHSAQYSIFYVFIQRMVKHKSTATFVLAILAACPLFGKPYALKTCGLENPAGFDLNAPTFSWKMDKADAAGKFGAAQTAYRLQIENARTNERVFDSKKTASDANTNVECRNFKADQKEKYVWRVKIWNEAGEESEWSDYASFETAFADPADWHAQTIAPKESGAPPTPAYFRKTFRLTETPELARIYVQSASPYRLSVNGIHVGGENAQTPSPATDTYDIAKLLKEGANTVGIIAAPTSSAGRPEIAAQMEIFRDGESALAISTDAAWQTCKGGLKKAAHATEIFNAPADAEDWDTPDFDGATENAVVVAPPRLAPPRNAVAKKFLAPICAVSVSKTQNETFVFDFAQNVCGTIMLDMPSYGGRTVKIRLSETASGLSESRYEIAYTFATALKAVWTPYFLSATFRYAEIDGLPENITPSADWLKAVPYQKEESTTFVCSDALLNAVSAKNSEIRHVTKEAGIGSALRRLAAAGETERAYEILLYGKERRRTQKERGHLFAKSTIEYEDAPRAEWTTPVDVRSVFGFLVEYVAGLKTEIGNGTKIEISPLITGANNPVGSARSTVDTPCGLAISGWNISDGVIVWEIAIPPNAKGRITFPSRNADTIRINGARPDEKKISENKRGFPVLDDVQSGEYRILQKL